VAPLQRELRRFPRLAGRLLLRQLTDNLRGLSRPDGVLACIAIHGDLRLLLQGLDGLHRAGTVVTVPVDAVSELVQALLQPEHVGACVVQVHDARTNSVLSLRVAVTVATATRRATDLDDVGVDATEHLREVLRGRGTARSGASPRKLDVDMVSVGRNTVVSAPARTRVGARPDLAIPDHTLDAEFLRVGDERVRQVGAIRGTVRPDAEVGGTTFTVKRGGAATTDGPAVVDAGVHALLGLVSGQEVVHRTPRVGLRPGRAGLSAAVGASEDRHQASPPTRRASSTCSPGS